MEGEVFDLDPLDIFWGIDEIHVMKDKIDVSSDLAMALMSQQSISSSKMDTEAIKAFLTYFVHDGVNKDIGVLDQIKRLRLKNSQNNRDIELSASEIRQKYLDQKVIGKTTESAQKAEETAA